MKKSKQIKKLQKQIEWQDKKLECAERYARDVYVAYGESQPAEGLNESWLEVRRWFNLGKYADPFYYIKERISEAIGQKIDEAVFADATSAWMELGYVDEDGLTAEEIAVVVPIPDGFRAEG